MDDASLREALARLEAKLAGLESKFDAFRAEFDERGEGAGCLTVLVACFCGALAAGGLLVVLLR